MGEVIKFKAKSEPKPSMPAWRQALLARWSNPANWTAGQGVGDRCGDGLGELMFSCRGLCAIIHLYEIEEGYPCGWTFRVAATTVALFADQVWMDRDDAVEAAWIALAELARDKMRAKR